jgi:pilus assembly protein Flp/PilA
VFAAESSDANTAYGTPVADSSSVARSSQQGVTAFRTHNKRASDDDAPEKLNMMNLIARMRAFAVNDEGQDLLEYALLVALIALVASAAIGLAGTNVNVIFGRIATQLGTTS